MKKVFFTIYLIVIMMISVNSSVFAEVFTKNINEDTKNTVCIVGNIDFYPIEYYDSKNNEFKGVIPDIFKKISDETGTDFTYIYCDTETSNQLARSAQVPIVSSYISSKQKPHIKQTQPLFSYMYSGKTIAISLGFTESADESLIELIEKEVSEISNEELNGYIISQTRTPLNQNDKLLSALSIIAVFIITVIILILFKTKLSIRKMKDNEQKDNETGIGNLVYFEYCFNNMIPNNLRSKFYVAYIIIDSNFLQLYHRESLFSDATKYIASVLLSYVKTNEIAARISENGFAFAFYAEDDESANTLIEEMIDTLNAYIEEDNKNHKHYFYTALYKLQENDLSSEVLLFNLRKNCSNILSTDTQLTICNEDMMNVAADEKKLLESIEKAFNNFEFKLHLQFIVDRKTKQIVSAEALSRWDNPEKGLLPPGTYIPVMESYGLITKLDYYMFDMTCKLLHKWHNTDLGHISISCNFTRITISEEDFIDKIEAITKKYVFDKSRLILEITEDAMEENREVARNNILKCKQLGFRIALDDMGSGYTSLINLCEYPIDIVKIDRDILLKTDKKNGRDLFNGIIALAHSLNLTVVCEGVETEEQDALVSRSECDYIQGWYYFRAHSQHDAEKIAKKYMNQYNN